MSTIYHKLILLGLVALGLISCDSGTSLQEYYVNHKENPDFVMLDVPTSLIAPNVERLTAEQQRILKTVKKVNILALPLKTSTRKEYETETAKVKKALDHDDFEQLMSFGKPNQRMQLFYKGDEDNIDELVVYARDDTKGFMLARVLGDKMNVGDMVKFAETIDKKGGGIDVSQFEGVMDIFNNR